MSRKFRWYGQFQDGILNLLWIDQTLDYVAILQELEYDSLSNNCIVQRYVNPFFEFHFLLFLIFVMINKSFAMVYWLGFCFAVYINGWVQNSATTSIFACTQSWL